MPFWVCLVNSAHEVFFGKYLQPSPMKCCRGDPVGFNEPGFGVGEGHAATGRSRFETRFGCAAIRRSIDGKLGALHEGWGDIGAFMRGHTRLPV